MVASSRAHLSAYSLRAALLIILAVAVGKMLHVHCRITPGICGTPRRDHGSQPLESLWRNTPG